MPNAVLIAQEKQKQLPPTKPKKKKNGIASIVFSLLIISFSFIIAFHFINTGDEIMLDTASKGYSAGKEAYENAKTQAAEEVYQNYYDSSYTYAERKNHVSNLTLITITQVEKINQLEVLKVSKNTVVVENSSDNASGTFSWLSLTGSAVYVVNLDMAEYLIDQHRSTVIVRIPKPTFEYQSINEIDNLTTHTKKKINNGSINEGETIAQNLINKGNEELLSELQADQDSPQKAKESAVSLITSLVKQANPEIPNLQVTVEFMD